MLWLNRKDEAVMWEERETEPLIDVAFDQVRSIARGMAHGPTYNPSSLGCRRCLFDECAVRFEPQSGIDTD